MAIDDWTTQLFDQLDGHWRHQLRPRLDGLADAEYLWEPVPDCWSIRPRGQARTPVAVGAGDYVLEWAHPAPDPAPVTTIAWRLAHITVGVFGMRSASHFGGPPVSYDSFEFAVTGSSALAQLDEAYATWAAGVRTLDADALSQPCGPAEGPFADVPMAGLVLHINREAIHHGAEVALLRDLYLRQG